MLEVGKTYTRNDGKQIDIGGRIRDYDEGKPWVWSLDGDWYDEQTGAVIHTRILSWDPVSGVRTVQGAFDIASRSSIVDHDPTDEWHNRKPALIIEQRTISGKLMDGTMIIAVMSSVIDREKTDCSGRYQIWWNGKPIRWYAMPAPAIHIARKAQITKYGLSFGQPA